MTDNSMSEHWSVDSWRSLSALHQPAYKRPQVASSVLSQVTSTQLCGLPPLVFPKEVDHLRGEFSDCESGRRFALHCGDSLETFESCVKAVLARKVKVFQGLRKRAEDILGINVTVVGRLAGQFARVNEEPYETVLSATGVPYKVPSYRGDMINCLESDLREPKPKKLLDAYYHSASVLNFLRQKHCRSDGEIYTSHEAILLEYESTLTRCASSGSYNLGAHMLWLGESAQKQGSAHIEYLSAVKNPVGIVVGASSAAEQVVDVMSKLNPDNDVGKVVLIPRLGVAHLNTKFPAIVSAVSSSGIPHTWELDPMHGNTSTTLDGIRTISVSDVIAEASAAIDILRNHGEVVGGVHLATACEEVTECVGGLQGTTDATLCDRYYTVGDPRLSVTQAEEVLDAVTAKIAAGD